MRGTNGAEEALIMLKGPGSVPLRAQGLGREGGREGRYLGRGREGRVKGEECSL